MILEEDRGLVSLFLKKKKNQRLIKKYTKNVQPGCNFRSKPR